MKLRTAGTREAVKGNGPGAFQQCESETNVPKLQEKEDLPCSRELCFLVSRRRDPKSTGENDPEHRLWGYSFRLGCFLCDVRQEVFLLQPEATEWVAHGKGSLDFTHN